MDLSLIRRAVIRRRSRRLGLPISPEKQTGQHPRPGVEHEEQGEALSVLERRSISAFDPIAEVRKLPQNVEMKMLLAALRPPLFLSTLPALAACATGIATPPHPADRKEVAANWAVEDAYSDGTRTVSMTREFGDLRLELKSYYAANGARWRSTGVGGDCSRRENESVGAGYIELLTEARRHLAAQLESCAVPPSEIAKALDGYGPAFSKMWTWHADAARWAALSEAALAEGPPGPNAMQDIAEPR